MILGDVLHSRVARSNIWTLTAMGADLWLCGPSTLLRGFEAWAARGAAGRRFTVTSDVDAALRDADVVMALRIQKERMASGLLPSLREYAARYGLTRERLRAASPDVVVMHPGPMNEGVEIAPDVAVGPAIGDHRAGHATASRSGWRCCTCSRARASAAEARRERGRGRASGRGRGRADAARLGGGSGGGPRGRRRSSWSATAALERVTWLVGRRRGRHRRRTGR